MHATTIVGYTYAADEFCPSCIIGQLSTERGGRFDGWALAPGVVMSVEANLAEIAAAFGIDRMDERSYDSGEFPKVIFASQVESDDERCGQCGDALIS